MNRDQILADSERRRNGLPILPVSLFRALLPAILSPSYTYPSYRQRAPFHRSLGNSLSREFRGTGRALPRMPLSSPTAILWWVSYLQGKVLQINETSPVFSPSADQMKFWW